MQASAATPDIVRRVIEIFVNTRGAAHAHACYALDARDKISAITARTSVVTGVEDYATPELMGRQLAERIPDASFTLWPAVRHFSLIESPGLRAFVARNLEPAS
jgi:3-oxoadipate enol-lactonase